VFGNATRPRHEGGTQRICRKHSRLGRILIETDRVQAGVSPSQFRSERQEATVLPASTHDNEATAALLDEAGWWGTTERLELVLVDRGVTQRAAQRLVASAGVEVRRVEVAHGRIGRAQRLAKSNESTTASASGWLQVACLMLVLRGP